MCVWEREHQNGIFVCVHTHINIQKKTEHEQNEIKMNAAVRNVCTSSQKLRPFDIKLFVWLSSKMTINFGFLLIYSFQKISVYNFVKPMVRIRCEVYKFYRFKVGFSVYTTRQTTWKHTHMHKMFACVL